MSKKVNGNLLVAGAALASGVYALIKGNSTENKVEKLDADMNTAFESLNDHEGRIRKAERKVKRHTKVIKANAKAANAANKGMGLKGKRYIHRTK